MRIFFREPASAGELLLLHHEQDFDRLFFQRDRTRQYLTIAWNQGPDQQVTIDEVTHVFPSGTLLPLVIQQSFRFENPGDIVAWQFNREFYCIIDHDKEVSCVGFIFYGSSSAMFIRPGESEERHLHQIVQAFIEEMQCEDESQATMLRTMMVRLIIKITRLAKQQYLTDELKESSKYDMLRQFNLLVEEHFRREHQVQFYAQQLNKSPKTLSNLFALYNHQSPLQVIHDRLVLEAKRLFHYTDKSAKEIAADLGFEDAAHFSRFFKNATQTSPSDYRKALQSPA